MHMPANAYTCMHMHAHARTRTQPWALVGQALVGHPGPLWAGQWAALGACGPGPCCSRGLLWSVLSACAPGPCEPRLGPCGPGSCEAPWALVGRALVGFPGPLWAGLLWAPWALMGRALVGLPRVYIHIYIYIYVKGVCYKKRYSGE